MMSWFKPHFLADEDIQRIADKVHASLLPAARDRVFELVRYDPVLKEDLVDEASKPLEDLRLRISGVEDYNGNLYSRQQDFDLRLSTFDKAIEGRKIDAAAIWQRLKVLESLAEDMKRAVAAVDSLSARVRDGEANATQSCRTMIELSENSLLRVVAGLSKRVDDLREPPCSVDVELCSMTEKIEDLRIDVDRLAEELKREFGPTEPKPEIALTEDALPSELRSTLEAAIRDGREIDLIVKAVPSKRDLLPIKEKGKKK